ncbi:MAG: DNA-3-methyladenine glycosylase [Candidatus Omnitrophica bacterium]|nr:DNA-3-methyladenine glycosylase [Candidatus Omnitrophota bacterium]MDD5430125.1 DNA-3-methyladenine glycosylase [Candidatus Omnitrophota bacterium]
MMSKVGENCSFNLLLKRTRKLSFFRRNARFIARSILGDYLVFKTPEGILAARIVETEAYLGVKDDASHSYGGKLTPRNKVTYEPGGCVYVYLIYGKYWCFNIVVSRQGDPQTVFIRALEPLVGIDIMKVNRNLSSEKGLTNGPCKWTKAFGIDKKILGKSIVSREFFISYNRSKGFKVVSAKRIGVDYANKSKARFLRFYIKGNAFVSKGV